MANKNENILKLRELTDRICNTVPEGEYITVLAELKNIIEEGKVKIESYSTTNSKVKCYENMCLKITKILNNVKL